MDDEQAAPEGGTETVEKSETTEKTETVEKTETAPEPAEEAAAA